MQSAPPVVEAATKKSYKGGWLDKDLRRANGRVGFAAGSKPRPEPLNELWAGLPSATIVDGWVTARDGSRFRVCPGCGAWTGLAKIARQIEDHLLFTERFYAKRGCECDDDDS